MAMEEGEVAVEHQAAVRTTPLTEMDPPPPQPLPPRPGSHASDEGEFVCGFVAALMNISATFPLNKLMFRQQLHGISGLGAARQLRAEGLRSLYRGLLPPLLQKTTSTSIMFGMYGKYYCWLEAEHSGLGHPAVLCTAAMLSGATEALLTPFERTQTLMQDSKYQKQFSNTLHAFRSLRFYSYREYYRGLVPVLLRNGPSNVLFFSGRELAERLLPLKDSGSQGVVKHFMCGAVMGAIISAIFYPVNVVKTRMQSQVGGPFKGFVATFRLVLEERQYSIRRLYLGVHANYIRSFLSWGITNTAFVFLMRHFFPTPPDQSCSPIMAHLRRPLKGENSQESAGCSSSKGSGSRASSSSGSEEWKHSGDR